jgi:hypothetical protein
MRRARHGQICDRRPIGRDLGANTALSHENAGLRAFVRWTILPGLSKTPPVQGFGQPLPLRDLGIGNQPPQRENIACPMLMNPQALAGISSIMLPLALASWRPVPPFGPL